MKKRPVSSCSQAQILSYEIPKRVSSKQAINLLRWDWHKFTLLPARLTNQRDFLLKAVLANHQIYGLISPEWRSDKEILLSALERGGGWSNYAPLSYASPEFLDDVAVIKKAIARDLGAFKFASARIKTNPDIVCELMDSNTHIFEHLSEQLRETPQVVLAAVAYHCGSFYYAANSLKNNRAFVTACLKPDGIKCNLIRYAGPKLRDDSEIIEKAIERFGGDAICAASPRLLRDRDLVKKAFVAGFRWNRNLFPDRWITKDREMILLAIERSSWLAFIDADSSFKNDLDFCIEAALANSDCIPEIPWSIRRRSAFKKAITLEAGPTSLQIHEAFELALENYDSSEKISGRGHAPRATLNRKVAASVRTLNLPRVHRSGFGANWLYPESLVRSAARILGVSMDSLTGL